MSKFPPIPDFTENLASIGNALRAVKDSIEQLTGQRQGQSLGAPSVFVQPLEPTPGRSSSLKRGDQWINDITDEMSYWDGQQWKALT